MDKIDSREYGTKLLNWLFQGTVPEESTLAMVNKYIDRQEELELKDYTELMSDHTKKERCINIICSAYNTTFDEINTLKQDRLFVLLRQEIMAFLKWNTKYSLVQIGSIFIGKSGIKNHATVLYACKNISNLIDTDKSFAEFWNNLKKAILFYEELTCEIPKIYSDTQ
jgi:chromosomal replication initiation ATPase DnaA